LVVHHYWKIDALKIWEIAQEDVPFLLARLSKLCDRLPADLRARLGGRAKS